MLGTVNTRTACPPATAVLRPRITRQARPASPVFTTVHVSRRPAVRCSAEGQASVSTTPSEDQEGEFVPVIAPEDLPKGVRKEVQVNGLSVLLFWYRNEIYATETRSPAEGAYSEGFMSAKFTQDYGIECPTTGTVFSLKDGSIMDFYPNNAVLRAITPQDTIRNLEIYPVKLTQDAICVNVSSSTRSRTSRGGADTSLEGNNVFFVEPKVKVEQSASGTASVATLIIAIVGTGIVAVAGTATAIYLEEYVLLAAFWVLLVIIAGSFAWPFIQSNIAGSD